MPEETETQSSMSKWQMGGKHKLVCNLISSGGGGGGSFCQCWDESGRYGFTARRESQQCRRTWRQISSHVCRYFCIEFTHKIGYVTSAATIICSFCILQFSKYIFKWISIFISFGGWRGNICRVSSLSTSQQCFALMGNCRNPVYLYIYTPTQSYNVDR